MPTFIKFNERLINLFYLNDVYTEQDPEDETIFYAVCEMINGAKEREQFDNKTDADKRVAVVKVNLEKAGSGSSGGSGEGGSYDDTEIKLDLIDLKADNTTNKKDIADIKTEQTTQNKDIKDIQDKIKDLNTR